MRNIREILRLRLVAGLSVRQINRSTKISIGSVQKLLSKANELEVSWVSIEPLNDTELALLFYPKAHIKTSRRFVMPDWQQVHTELKRKGMTKQLLWEEIHRAIPQQLLQLCSILCELH